MKIKHRYNISYMLNNSIFLFILLAAFFKPSGLVCFPPVFESAWNILRVIAVAIVGLMYLYNSKVSKIIACISIYEIILFFSTIINNGDYRAFFIACLQDIAFCMLIEMALQCNFRKLCNMLVLLLGLLCTINFLTILIFPGGMYRTIYSQNWFLGYDNTHSLYIIPFLLMYSLKNFIYKSGFNVSSISIILFFSLQTYITWAASGVVGVTLFIAYAIILHKIKLERLLNIKVYFWGNIILTLLIVFFRFQNIFSFIIIDILKKDLTFTGRTDIWDNGIHWFLKSPLIGNGVCSNSVSTLKLEATHCHNFFLQVLFQSGIIGFIAFLAVMFTAMKPLLNTSANKYSKLISFTICCFLIMFQVEAFAYMTTFWGLVTMAYHINTIISQANLPKKNEMPQQVQSHSKHLWRRTFMRK